MFLWLKELLFPRKCVLCGKLLEREETDLCRVCRVDSPEYPQGKLKIQFLDSFAAIWYYEGNIRRSLLRYKFYGARHYASAYGRILAMKLLREYPDGFEVLTWTPISPLRKFRRGYDQVELLAQTVAEELGMEITPTLTKIRHNPPQSGIQGYAKRKANVLGAYRAEHQERFRGKRVLLLDDIVTTGATASEAARVLLTAGAKEVTLAAIAAASHEQKNSQ